MRETIPSQQEMQKMHQRYGDTAAIVQSDNAGIPKMSEIIIDYADELLAHAPTQADEEKALMLAMTGWNLALMTTEARAAALEDFLQKSGLAHDAEASRAIQDLLETLIEQKLTHYPHINRFIVDFEFTGTGDNARFNVVSTVPEAMIKAHQLANA